MAVAIAVFFFETTGDNMFYFPVKILCLIQRIVADERCFS